MGLGWHPIYEMENNIHVPNHQPVIDDLPRRDTWANQPDTLQKKNKFLAGERR